LQDRPGHRVNIGFDSNLCLRVHYEIVEFNGDFAQYTKKMQRTPSRRLVLISVNAATDSQSTMDQTPKQPSIAASISAMRDVQLRTFSTDTIALVEKCLKPWAAEISTPDQPVEPCFILLDFNLIDGIIRGR
jgi:hypothetical protein